MDRLSELNLQCAQVTQQGGVYSWKQNAVLYYRIQEVNDEFEGSYLHIDWRIGGKRKEICERLKSEFQRILDSLLERKEDQ